MRIRFAVVSVSVNQRTLIQVLAEPRARQQKGAFMNTNSRIPSLVLSTPKTPIAGPSFTTGGGAMTTTTLNQDQVQEVLSRLYAEAQANDSKVQAEEQALLAAGGGVIDDQTLQSINDRTFMAVAPEVGRLIYLLVRSRPPALVVEFGTSFGLSALHIASALRDNRIGPLDYNRAKRKQGVSRRPAS